jgi:chloramphenicol-sensitive protein RarD
MTDDTHRSARLGAISAASAFVIWGLTPVFWKLLQEVPALEILAHRIVWGLLLIALWMTARRRWNDLVIVFQTPRTLMMLLASTFFIAVNWGIFIYAVNTDRVLSTSLGYYINPLVNVLLGLVVLRERLDRAQWIAVGLAAAAVLILTARLGQLPWLSLALAFSFGFYGLLRKTVRADAIVGLTFETAILTPLAVAFLMVADRHGTAFFGHHGLVVDGLLVASGAVTVIPLILFTLGVRRLPLSTAGLLQYIAPTCTFILATLLYGEPFTAWHGVAFTLIWIALAIYSWDLRVRLRRQRIAAGAT